MEYNIEEKETCDNLKFASPATSKPNWECHHIVTLVYLNVTLGNLSIFSFISVIPLFILATNQSPASYQLVTLN